MGSRSLNNILVTPLKRILVDGGDVLHAMKKSDPGYDSFGEAYFSHIKENYIKAWKKHQKMTMNFVVPIGEVRFVFAEEKANRCFDFRVEEIGISKYCRLTVPPGIWFGFKGIGVNQSLVLNIANTVHDPNETERLQVNEIKFDWN